MEVLLARDHFIEVCFIFDIMKILKTEYIYINKTNTVITSFLNYYWEFFFLVICNFLVFLTIFPTILIYYVCTLQWQTSKHSKKVLFTVFRFVTLSQPQAQVIFTLVSIPAVIIMQWNEACLRPFVQCAKIINIIISVFFSTPEVWENNLKKEYMVYTNIFQYTS